MLAILLLSDTPGDPWSQLPYQLSGVSVQFPPYYLAPICYLLIADWHFAISLIQVGLGFGVGFPSALSCSSNNQA